uniref:Uncharacterized protein n=1 Tax=Nicotiana tabacum TaxID=4097 RepID=A0A1S4AAI8_TOBAC|nr:PREDICTED: uncharacterized protein LOC107795510 [Nicotiana tabacum]
MLGRLSTSHPLECGFSLDALCTGLPFFLAGTWLGFWVVHKFVLAEDGSIDIGVSQYVGWSIRVFALGLIIQSSLDLLLVLEALICGVLILLVLRRLFRPKYVLRFCKNLLQIDTLYLWRCQDSYTSLIKGHMVPGLPREIEMTQSVEPSSLLSETDTFDFTFHNTSERKKLSKDEWNKLARDTTKKAMEELVSSPDLSKWVVAHADRITLYESKFR